MNDKVREYLFSNLYTSESNYTKHSKKHSYIVNIKKESILDVDNIWMFFKEPYFMKVRRWRLIGNAAQLKYKNKNSSASNYK